MTKLSEKIKKNLDNVKPKPKWEFTTYEMLKDLFLAFLWVNTVILIGIIIYILSRYNPWEDLPNKLDYHLDALKTLPWELITIALLLLAAIYFITRKINFMYRMSPYVTLGVVIVSIGGGYFLAEKIGINNKIANAPVAREIYKKQGKILIVSRGITATGEIIEVGKNDLLMNDSANRNWVVLVGPKTHIYSIDKGLILHDYILVNGIKVKDGTIQAFLIREMDENWRGFYERIITIKKINCPSCTK